jgi:hypothetical protein
MAGLFKSRASGDVIVPDELYQPNRVIGTRSSSVGARVGCGCGAGAFTAAIVPVGFSSMLGKPPHDRATRATVKAPAPRHPLPLPLHLRPSSITPFGCQSSLGAGVDEVVDAVAFMAVLPGGPLPSLGKQQHCWATRAFSFLICSPHCCSVRVRFIAPRRSAKICGSPSYEGKYQVCRL